MNTIQTPQLEFIGQIRTPYTEVSQCPNNIQPQDGPVCEIQLRSQYYQGLVGLGVGQKILVLYWLSGANHQPEMMQGKKGTFALRSPHRPNPIGAAVLPIESIDEGVIKVRGLDCLDSTPLVDIKPAIYFEA
ncbi:SAM-dependent methyltransferase [Vibrio harveyi]|uniref:SAM-dependent methyltransferase n=1 Tax=Vibrio harveyi TaxID=669 RepID=UPI00237FD822|nr:SAM-dependent methyltransferase [Vibrio harveyi]WDZ74872.1 SAM-dependent methyltransferase [Vibrio harveyi]